MNKEQVERAISEYGLDEFLAGMDASNKAVLTGIILSALRTPRTEVAAPTCEQIMQAVARGWCHRDTEHKEMDPHLAVAISAEVLALFSPLEANTPEKP